MANPEFSGGRPIELGPIEAQEPSAKFQSQLEKLDKAISDNPELQARIATLRNPNISPEVLIQMVDSWNGTHAPTRGFYVERTFNGAAGIRLIIRMDQSGNIELKGLSERK